VVRLILLSLTTCFLGHCLLAQEKVTLSGYIRGAEDGEALIGASVYFPELSSGTISNAYGFYSISVLPGTYQVTFRYVGFYESFQELDLSADRTYNMDLAEEEVTLEEVIISGDRAEINVTSVEMSTNRLNIKTVQKMPTLLGEVDILSSIKMLPGVSAVGEGTRGFNVRGGGIDQNLVLLDEAPVYNSSHLFGFFSVFNPDAVKDLKLIKGGIPAQYGGRLSSILDVRMKEGNKKRFEGSGGVGLIFSRLTLEAPLAKDKASFVVAARRSYIDILAKPFLSDDFSNSAFNFWDFTVKTNVSFNPKNTLFLSGYLGRDKFKFGDEAAFNWGNGTATLRWNHLFQDKLFSNVTLFYSNYDYELSFGSEGDTFDWSSRIINYSGKAEFIYYPNPNNNITFGGQIVFYDFEPANAVGQSAGESQAIVLDNKYALESSIYIANEQTVNRRFSLNYGLRYSFFNLLGPGTAYEYDNPDPGTRRTPISSQDFQRWESIQTYGTLEPRFSARYLLGSSSIKASYNRTAQYIHLISNTTGATPLDVWTPSTNNIAPQRAHQVALGYFKNLRENTLEASAEVYYKIMENQIDYIDGADLLINEFLEGELLSGDGRAYGIEFMVKKNLGRFTGWAGYTLARTERKIEGINRGEWYPSRWDQTHNLNLASFYELNDRWSFSANFVLISGTPATFPTNRIEFQSYIIPHNYQATRNNHRIPSTHRLDLSARLDGKLKEGKRWRHYWVFSIYNVYNRKNPFSIFFQQDEIRPIEGTPIQSKAVQFSVVGNFIPSVSYNFNF